MSFQIIHTPILFGAFFAFEIIGSMFSLSVTHKRKMMFEFPLAHFTRKMRLTAMTPHMHFQV